MLSVPYNEELERAVIVGVLSDPNIISKISTKLSSQDFYKNNHKEIYKVVESINPEKLDSLTVEDNLPSDELKQYFKELVEESDRILPSLSNIGYYAEIIRDKARLRAGIHLGQEITAICFEPNAEADDAMENLETLFSRFIRERIVATKAETTAEAFSTFFNNLGAKKPEGGVKTGFYDVDLMLHDLEGLIILAARPSVGKTAFAINVARNVARTQNVLFFSLEQSREQVFERLLAAESEISLEEIRTQAYKGDRIAESILLEASVGVQKALSRLYIDDTANVSSSYISSVSRQKYLETGRIDLIIVDYLHIMKLGDKNIIEALGDTVKELRALGKELDCPVLLLSQLRRQQDSQNQKEEKKNRRPELQDLRSSGEIEQSADIVMFLHRESYYSQAGLAPDDDIVEVIIRKHRNGRTGILPLRWIPKFMKFKDAR